MIRLASMLLLLLVGSAVSAETIWLRGRGADVWIERDGRVQEPQENRKGFTRVATPPRPLVYRGRPAERRETRRSSAVVEVGPDCRHLGAYPPDDVYPHSHGYAHYPRYRYGHHRDGDHRYGQYHRSGSHGYERHRSGRDGRGHSQVRHGGRSSGGQRGGGFVQRGGAYRRSR